MSSPVLYADDFHSANVFFFFPKQTDEQEVITFLLTTEIIPLCLRIMEAGSELSKTVSMLTVRFLLLSLGGPLQHLSFVSAPARLPALLLPIRTFHPGWNLGAESSGCC